MRSGIERAGRIVAAAILLGASNGAAAKERSCKELEQDMKQLDETAMKSCIVPGLKAAAKGAGDSFMAAIGRCQELERKYIIAAYEHKKKNCDKKQF